MRLLLGLGCLLLAGCSGPHSTGGLWAQENLEREAALFRLTDAQRAEGASAFELSVADESLAAERSRVEAALSDCPGDRRALAISSGDKVRDTVRLPAQPRRCRSISPPSTVARSALAVLHPTWVDGRRRPSSTTSPPPTRTGSPTRCTRL